MTNKLLPDYKYQLDFAAIHSKLYNIPQRKIKAQKIASVLQDFYHSDLKNKTMLDIGASTGIMTNLLSSYFGHSIGIDIDEGAIQHASKTYSSPRLSFSVQDAMNIKLPANSIDIIICNQVYEHVPDAKRLMKEIYRLLKPHGVCYFGAGNRFVLMEEHYHLPLLSAIPKFLAHPYIKLFRHLDTYYETHYSYWRLKKLCQQFKIHDYTPSIVNHPRRFYATDMLLPGSRTQTIARFLVNYVYWLFPSYVWLLEKN